MLSSRCANIPSPSLQSHGIIQDPRPQFPRKLDAGIHELGAPALLAMSCFPVGQLTILAAVPRTSACAALATTGAVLEAPYTEPFFDHRPSVTQLHELEPVSYTHLTLPTICSV